MQHVLKPYALLLKPNLELDFGRGNMSLPAKPPSRAKHDPPLNYRTTGYRYTYRQACEKYSTCDMRTSLVSRVPVRALTLTLIVFTIIYPLGPVASPVFRACLPACTVGTVPYRTRG